MSAHSDLITSTGAAVSRLATAIVQAAEVQYLPPAGPSTRNEEPIRPIGGVSDPTSATALDERRLALRAAVIEGEMVLEKATADADAAAGKLEATLADWAGVRA